MRLSLLLTGCSFLAGGFLVSAQVPPVPILPGATPGAAVTPGQTAQAATVGGIKVEEYYGWPGCLHLAGGDARMVIAPAVGGRIIQYALNNENVIYENPISYGRTLARSGDTFWAGGYQLDLGPELRNIPAHPQLFIGPWRWNPKGPNAVTLVSEIDPVTSMQLEKDILMDPDSGELGITQRMRNLGAAESSYCLWDRTQCHAGGTILVPMKRGSRFKSGWSVRKKTDQGYVYEDGQAGDPRFEVVDRVLSIRARGPAIKIGVDSDAEWVAYVRSRVMFVKFFPITKGANYSDNGHTVEVYCDEKIVELQTLSPEVKLGTGQTYEFPAQWVFVDLREEPLSTRQLREALKAVPKSPFKGK